jgi:PIN domain nuclease of toxin-antitoxin system
LAIVNKDEESVPDTVRTSGMDLFVSTATLWEISIKYRLGKLRVAAGLEDLPGVCGKIPATILSITAEQAIHEALPVPDTRDPFDRLLLAVCDVERLRLVTTDGALKDHPLAWR